MCFRVLYCNLLHRLFLVFLPFLFEIYRHTDWWFFRWGRFWICFRIIKFTFHLTYLIRHVFEHSFFLFSPSVFKVNLYYKIFTQFRSFLKKPSKNKLRSSLSRLFWRDNNYFWAFFSINDTVSLSPTFSCIGDLFWGFLRLKQKNKLCRMITALKWESLNWRDSKFGSFMNFKGKLSMLLIWEIGMRLKCLIVWLRIFWTLFSLDERRRTSWF